MKRILAFALVVVLLILCACSKQPDATDADDAESTNAASTDPSQEIDASDDNGWNAPDSEDGSGEDGTGDESSGKEGPIALTNYVYTTYTNEDLHVSYKHPSHWIMSTAERSVAYEEPAQKGIVPARMALARKDAGDIVVTEDVGRDKLTAFRQSLKASCKDFKWEGKKIRFAGNVGFQFTYTGDFSGTQMKGYAALAYSRKEKAFYLFHFSTSQDRYKSFEQVIKTILNSIKVP